MSSLKQEIACCKTLVLHNLQPTITPGIISSYLQASKKRYPINKLHLNSKQQPIKLEFFNHYEALSFYEQFNYKQKILRRPLNMSLDLILDINQQRRYQLEGVSLQNQRQIFEAALKITICKLYIDYEVGQSFQPDSKALLSFLTEQDLSQAEQRELFIDLSKLGVKISKELQAFEETIEYRLKSCKKIIIKNMQDDIYHKNAFDFLKKNNLLNSVKQFSVSRKQKSIKIEFFLHGQALYFYNDRNFVDKILSRPINISFDVNPAGEQMKRYYIQGVNENNLRNIFEIAFKIDKCKIQTSYGPDNKSKLQQSAEIVFLSSSDISKHDLNFLAQKLKQFGVILNKQPLQFVKKQLIPINKDKESSLQNKVNEQQFRKQKLQID